MKFFTQNFCKFAVLLAYMTAGGTAYSAAATNPRGVSNTNSEAHTTSNATASRSDARRAATAVTTARTTTSRAGGATRGVSAVIPGVTSAQNIGARTATVVRTAATPERQSRAASTNLVRSTINHTGAASKSRAAVATNNASRARATAVFSDISKIGGGYANCRESYATCMDQFCANANDTYRRCFCSDRFTEFRNSENALDQAKLLLMQFQDNNLNAVDKTAAEVNAMYTATAGELAIKKDTSGASKMLSEINDLLSGKRTTTSSNTGSTSLGILSFDFSTSMDDIWGGDGGSIFSSSTGTNMADLEGAALYNAAHKQCMQVMGDACESSAVLNMATSSYGILITQDCNAYQKSIDSKKETVQQTVRTAEKYLREARLEEYRAHNSADVNECLTKVRSAMLTDVACGENYKRCLDYSGAYINQSTGEPIYSTRLFQLADMITLNGIDGTSDVLSTNPRFNTFLDEKRIFAQTALDSCRDMADIVWREFKRTALIEIAQAQDEKIEEIKMSCVSTMAECYDTQTGALQDFDTTTSKLSGALSASAARAMCEEKVMACATLYGNTDGCTFSKDGKLTSRSSGNNCGLTALLNFVNTVDNVRVAEGCQTAIENHLKELCTPTSGTRGYPWNCRTLSVSELEKNISDFVLSYCKDPALEGDGVSSESKAKATRALEDLKDELNYQLAAACEELDGYWIQDQQDMTVGTSGNKLTAFYTTVNGGKSSLGDDSLGGCYENTTMLQCLQYNDPDKGEAAASYDRGRDECTFTDAWFASKCTLLDNGYFDNGICYTKPD